MKRIRRLALVISLLTATAGASGQAPEAAQPIPPEVLAPSAEAQAQVEALRANPATGDLLAGLPAEQTAPMDTIIAELFRRGEAVADWQRRGVNIHAMLATLPGGASAHMTESMSQFGPIRAYLGDPHVESLIPGNWFLVARYGERREGGVIQTFVARLSPKIIMVARSGIEALGNANCPLHTQTMFYADPAVPASQMDIVAIVLTLRTLPRYDRERACSVIEENSPGVFTTRYFDREGRRLPGHDANDMPFRIVPRATFR